MSAAPRPEFANSAPDKDGGHTLVADISGDSRNDIVIHHEERLAWLEYPRFTRHVIQEGSFFGDRFAAVDIDNDGDLDIASGRKPNEESFHLFWYENPGDDGEWMEHYVGDQGEYIKDLVAADIDRDGRTDLVARCHTFTKIHFQSDDDWKTISIKHPRKEGLAVGDLDLDGDLDLVLNGFWLETPKNPLKGDFIRHTIDPKWFNQETGSWQDNNAYVGVADINGDEIPDVVLAHSEKTGYPISWYSVDAVAKVKNGDWEEHQIAETYD